MITAIKDQNKKVFFGTRLGSMLNCTVCATYKPPLTFYSVLNISNYTFQVLLSPLSLKGRNKRLTT